MTYQEIFGRIQKTLSKADTSKCDKEFVLQCNITGEGEGAFYIAYKDGELIIEPYDYKDNDAMLYASGENFEKLLSGKMDGTAAFLTGKLKIDGSIEAAKMLSKLKPDKKKDDKKPVKPEKKPEAKKAEKKPEPKKTAEKTTTVKKDNSGITATANAESVNPAVPAVPEIPKAPTATSFKPVEPGDEIKK